MQLHWIATKKGAVCAVLAAHSHTQTRAVRLKNVGKAMVHLDEQGVHWTGVVLPPARNVGGGVATRPPEGTRALRGARMRNAPDSSLDRCGLHRRSLLASLLAGSGILFGVSACAYQTHRIRYELKLIVKVDGEQREGSSVIEVEFTDLGESSLRPQEMPRVSARSWGEAVVVDMGKHGLLFGLLGTSLSNSSNFNVNHVDSVLVQFLPPDEAKYERRFHAFQRLSGEFALQQQDWPALVRFTNINDPATAQLVDSPGSMYGPGVSLVKVTIAVTQKEVTRKIDGYLPWLKDQPPGSLVRYRLDAPRSEQPLSAQLVSVDFRRNGE